MAEAISAVPLTLTPRLRSQSAAVALSPLARNEAAQLTSARTGSPSPSAALAAARQSSQLETSPVTPTAAGPKAATVRARRSPSRSKRTTLAPAATKASAVAWPMPEAPPVMTATVPAKVPAGVEGRTIVLLQRRAHNDEAYCRRSDHA